MSSLVSDATEGRCIFDLGVDGLSRSESCVELGLEDPRREDRTCMRCDGTATGVDGVRRSIRKVRNSSNCSLRWGSRVVNKVESVRKAEANICGLSDRMSLSRTHVSALYHHGIGSGGSPGRGSDIPRS